MKNMTQPELCRLLSIHQTHISKIERNERTPSLSLLAHIIQVLDIPVSEAFEGNKDFDLTEPLRTGSAKIYSPVFSGLGKLDMEMIRTFLLLDDKRKHKVLIYAQEQKKLKELLGGSAETEEQ